MRPLRAAGGESSIHRTSHFLYNILLQLLLRLPSDTSMLGLRVSRASFRPPPSLISPEQHSNNSLFTAPPTGLVNSALYCLFFLAALTIRAAPLRAPSWPPTPPFSIIPLLPPLQHLLLPPVQHPLHPRRPQAPTRRAAAALALVAFVASGNTLTQTSELEQLERASSAGPPRRAVGPSGSRQSLRGLPGEACCS